MSAFQEGDIWRDIGGRSGDSDPAIISGGGRSRSRSPSTVGMTLLSLASCSQDESWLGAEADEAGPSRREGREGRAAKRDGRDGKGSGKGKVEKGVACVSVDAIVVRGAAWKHGDQDGGE